MDGIDKIGIPYIPYPTSYKRNKMDELAKLKDIKPAVNIDTTLQEVALYVGAGVGLLVVSILLVLLYLMLFKKRRKKPTKRELALKALKGIDYTNTKDAVYTFSVNAQKLISNEDKKELDELLKELEKYKYKKEVSALSREDIDKMKKIVEKLKA